MGRQRDLDKERFWRRTIREWRRSGLSVREFCDWQQLSEAAFFAWRRKLVERDQDSESQIGKTVAVQPQFIPVQVVPDVARDVRAVDCLEVQLPTGVRLQIPAGFDRQTLADVLAILEPRAC